MEKNYAVRIVKDGETRFLANEIRDGWAVHKETMGIKLTLYLSPVPVPMTQGDADFWVDCLQGEQGVIIEAKALRDIDLESLDTH